MSLDPERSISQKNRALAGIIGPATFALTIVVLTLVRYDFMVGLVWHPTHSSDVPWPSGLRFSDRVHSGFHP
jgi:hypothetical protein